MKWSCAPEFNYPLLIRFHLLKGKKNSRKSQNGLKHTKKTPYTPKLTWNSAVDKYTMVLKDGTKRILKLLPVLEQFLASLPKHSKKIARSS